MVELHAYLYATGIVLGAVVATLLVHTYCFESDFLGMQMRVATCSLAYNKVNCQWQLGGVCAN